MKILKKTLLILIIVSGFIACEKDDPISYYSVLGILSINNDSVIIDSDAGEKLLINNSIQSYFEDGDRVVAVFSLMDEELPEGIDYLIEISDIDTVLFKPIIELTSENSDSLGDDPLQVDDLWIAKDYMNINFSYYGGQATHFINLAMDNNSTASDTVTLEIRHNANGDNGTYPLASFVSFDLSKAKDASADSVVLKIVAQDFNDKVLEKNIIYRY